MIILLVDSPLKDLRLDKLTYVQQDWQAKSDEPLSCECFKSNDNVLYGLRELLNFSPFIGVQALTCNVRTSQNPNQRNNKLITPRKDKAPHFGPRRKCAANPACMWGSVCLHRSLSVNTNLPDLHLKVTHSNKINIFRLLSEQSHYQTLVWSAERAWEPLHYACGKRQRQTHCCWDLCNYPHL